MTTSIEPMLQEEAKKLTTIGNSFQIPHTETDKEPLADSAHVDYLYARLLSLIYLLMTDRKEAVNQ